MASVPSLRTEDTFVNSEDISDQVSSARSLHQSPKGDSSLNELFLRFEAFDFNNDEQFQAGLSKIATLSEANNANSQKDRSADLLRVKAFYYSKHVEPFTFSEYMEWNQEQKNETCRAQNLQSASAKVHASKSVPSQTSAISKVESSSTFPVTRTGEEQHQQVTNCGQSRDANPSSTYPVLGSGDGHHQTETNCEQSKESTEALVMGESGQATDNLVSPEIDRELSFAEVAELIQSGQTIPGLSSVEVQPTNQDPSPSLLQRAKKPWEV